MLLRSRILNKGQVKLHVKLEVLGLSHLPVTQKNYRRRVTRQGAEVKS